DYPAGRFTLARPGTLEPRGEPVPTAIQPSNGFPRLEVEIGGERFGFLLDTGASFSMVSIEQLKRWQEADESLPWMTGAVGEANMLGGAFDTQAIMMRLPAMRWGPFELKGVAAVSRRAGTFERNMSSMMTAPIIGALGSSLLRHFRVEIDYAAGVTYLEPAGEDFSTKLHAVGLVLSQTQDGRHRVDGIAMEGSSLLCSGVQPGDFLRSIDGRSVDGLCHRQVVELLCGGWEAGIRHALVLDRNGETVEASAPMVAMLPFVPSPPP
ncbi:MAG TPA: aspartyl protease family protein, partial [Planctomycetota bacterium]|nr:aspartyl protease family protein [Planctomycetota bacterium]